MGLQIPMCHGTSLMVYHCKIMFAFSLILLCVSPTKTVGFPPELRLDKAEPDSYVHNMTSFHPQTLFCPLRVFAAHDLVIWFKDGRPIKDLEDEEERVAFGFKNGRKWSGLLLVFFCFFFFVLNAGNLIFICYP